MSARGRTPIRRGFAALALLVAASLPHAPALASPNQLSTGGQKDFAAYLSGSTHKAFAVSPNGAYARRTRQRSAEEARAAALEACAKYRPDCAVYAIDDALTK